MKNLITSICFLILATWTFTANAQVPEGINYQAVVRNASGEIMANENVLFSFSIVLTASNNLLYSETQLANTNEFGLVNLVIGNGTPTFATFESLTWDAPYSIKTQIEVEGNTIDLGISEFQSVPYALNAESAASLLPTATVNTSQLTTIGATNNQVLQFNGSNWVAANLPAGNAGGGLDLPFSETDTYDQALFHVTNQNLGAIEGFSTNGTGVYGSSINSSALSGVSWGNSSTVSGINNAAGSGVQGYSENGVGVAGQSVSSSLPGVLGTNNNGIGVKGQTSKDGAIGVFGNSTGEGGRGIVGSAEGVTGKGVMGTSDDGTGVYGNSNNATGVSGNGAIGVHGSSSSGTGIHGSSTYGVGVYAFSEAGTAFQTDGVVNISGLSQSPAQGKILTSDATGNATWQGAIAFAATNSGNQHIENNGDVEKILFIAEAYDVSNNYDLASKTFTAPVHGIYHFDVQIEWAFLWDDMSVYLYLMMHRNAWTGYIFNNQEYIENNGAHHSLMSCDFELYAGDQIWIGIDQLGGDDAHLSSDGASRFSGRLVVNL